MQWLARWLLDELLVLEKVFPPPGSTPKEPSLAEWQKWVEYGAVLGVTTCFTHIDFITFWYALDQIDGDQLRFIREVLTLTVTKRGALLRKGKNRSGLVWREELDRALTLFQMLSSFTLSSNPRYNVYMITQRGELVAQMVLAELDQLNLKKKRKRK